MLVCEPNYDKLVQIYGMSGTSRLLGISKTAVRYHLYKQTHRCVWCGSLPETGRPYCNKCLEVVKRYVPPPPKLLPNGRPIIVDEYGELKKAIPKPDTSMLGVNDWMYIDYEKEREALRNYLTAYEAFEQKSINENHNRIKIEEESPKR